MRLAFMGFRHGHAIQFYHAASTHPGIEIVAACEDDAATAEALRRDGNIRLTHATCDDMLFSVECDAVSIGDCYGRRGRLVLAALKSGRHVISDKPVCTRLEQLDQIERLSRDKRLKIGCLLDFRGSGPFLTARRLIAGGTIGTVHTVAFSGQHPLRYGTRPAWYFEKDMHGGTINDIGVHAFDAIPWITGRKIVEVVSARAWNARLSECPHFQDAAQVMLELDNGGGVLGDVSYLAPDGCGYAVEAYWRMTFHGSGGMIECGWSMPAVRIAQNQDNSPRTLKPDANIPNAAVDAFLRDVAGDEKASPNTAEVLEASRLALLIQKAADEHVCNMSLARQPLAQAPEITT